MIGEKLSPVLSEIESALWEFESLSKGRPYFTDAGLRAAIKIFSTAIFDKMWELCERENLGQKDRINMAMSLGDQIRKMVKTFTNIDPHNL